MSVVYCEDHHRYFDSDFEVTCHLCEEVAEREKLEGDIRTIIYASISIEDAKASIVKFLSKDL
jgi:hypothetical protein